jgi:hypothetical protein
MRNVITGENMDKENPLEAWQEFVLVRQEMIDCKLEYRKLSSEYLQANDQIQELLKGLPEEQATGISDAIMDLTSTATYIHYNKGFFDGLKIAMVLGNL